LRLLQFKGTLYDVLEVLAAGTRSDAWKRTLLATSAQEIVDLRPTD
jgi:hypothetical protein